MGKDGATGPRKAKRARGESKKEETKQDDVVMEEPKVEETDMKAEVTEPAAGAEPKAEEPVAEAKEEKDAEKAVEKVEEKAEKTEDKTEEVKEDVVVEEVEEPEPIDERARIQHRAQWSTSDRTFNLMQNGMLLTNVNTCHLWSAMRACVRADTGIKTGSYAFEIMLVQAHNNFEALTGFSVAGHKLYETKNEGGCFLELQFFAKKGDVIATRLTRSAEEGTSITWFVNGKEKKTLKWEKAPADELVFPHVVFRGAGMVTNFGLRKIQSIKKVRMLNDAALEDVSLVPSRQAPVEAALLLPLVIPSEQSEFIKTFVAGNPSYEDASGDEIRAWAKASGLHDDTSAKKTNPAGQKLLGDLKDDFWCVQQLASLNTCRKLMVSGTTLTAKDRKEIMDLFPLSQKVCAVNFKASTSDELCGLVELPKEEEAFDEITYVTPKEEAVKAAEAWNERSKKFEIVDFKLPDKDSWFAKFWASVDETKKKHENTEEYKDWTKEDWILFIYRCRIHSVLHSFPGDLNDPERPRFALANLPHYSSRYGKPITPDYLGVKDMDGVSELVPDMFTVEDSMVVPVQEKDVPMTKLLEMTDEERQNRLARFEAGDETAKLTFSAKNKHRGGKNRGGQYQQQRGDQKQVPLVAFPATGTDSNDNMPRMSRQEKRQQSWEKRSGKNNNITATKPVHRPFMTTGVIPAPLQPAARSQNHARGGQHQNRFQQQSPKTVIKPFVKPQPMPYQQTFRTSTSTPKWAQPNQQDRPQHQFGGRPQVIAAHMPNKTYDGKPRTRGGRNRRGGKGRH